MNKKSILGASIALALGVSANANAYIIDLFSVGQGSHTDTTIDATAVGSEVSDAADPGTILTGYRDIAVSLTSSPDPANLNATVVVAAGQFSFSTDSQAAGTAYIQWDGMDGDFTTLTNDGVTDDISAMSAFVLDVIFSDGGFDFTIQAQTSATEFSNLTLTAAPAPVPTQFIIPFASFDCANPAVVCDGANNGVNFAQLDALGVILDINGTATSLDLSIDSITHVPEPATLSLFGMGLLGMGAAASRRKKAQSS